MSDSALFPSGATEVTVVACDCFSAQALVERALAQMPTFNGSLVWRAPRVCGSVERESDVDLVLVVSGEESLSQAISRVSDYKQLEQSVILIYLRNDEGIVEEEVPGLALDTANLAAGLLRLTQALFAPVIPQGLVCIDWGDTRHLLEAGGQIILGDVSGPEPAQLIEAAVSRLKRQASGRSIRGIQASVFCGPDNLSMCHVLDLLAACKEAAGEEATLIMGAPFLDWGKSVPCEVRLLAKVE